MHRSEDSDRSHETNDEDVEDDEDPQPAKRRKLPSAPAHEGVIPQPHSLTPPSATQLEEFLVAWEPTWMPESELGGARELVGEFKARLSVRHGKKSGQGKTGVTGKRLAKRRRGRPRKRP